MYCFGSNLAVNLTSSSTLYTQTPELSLGDELRITILWRGTPIVVSIICHLFKSQKRLFSKLSSTRRSLRIASLISSWLNPVTKGGKSERSLTLLIAL